MNKKPNIAVMLFPWASKAPYQFVSDILKILKPSTNELYLITSNLERIDFGKAKTMDVRFSVHYAKEMHPIFISYLIWIFKSFLIQIITSIYIIKISNKVDIIIYLAYPFYFIPLITSKIFGIKGIELLTRSKRTTRNKILKFYLDNNEKFVFSLLDGISPESPSLIQELNLNRFEEKLLPYCSRYVKLNEKFTKINNRENIIGYIGRLREEKGIIEFIESIPRILNERQDVKFLIGGEGDLSSWVEKEINKLRDVYDADINFVRWIPHTNIYDYLNNLKILVIPSRSEGLPTIILEAMANGTPVLAMPVGGIKDLIEDNENGFFLQSYSSESIKLGVLKILESSNIDLVSINAINTIKTQFTFDKAIERYHRIINLV